MSPVAYLPLKERARYTRPGAPRLDVTRAPAFAWSRIKRNGVSYLHRPKYGNVVDGRVYLHFWCGTYSTRLGACAVVPPRHWPLCRRCEERALQAGLPPAAELLGYEPELHDDFYRRVSSCAVDESPLTDGATQP